MVASEIAAATSASARVCCGPARLEFTTLLLRKLHPAMRWSACVPKMNCVKRCLIALIYAILHQLQFHGCDVARWRRWKTHGAARGNHPRLPVARIRLDLSRKGQTARNKRMNLCIVPLFGSRLAVPVGLFKAQRSTAPSNLRSYAPARVLSTIAKLCFFITDFTLAPPRTFFNGSSGKCF